MSDITRAMLNDLLPPGPIWEPEELAEFDLLLEGIADNLEVARAFLSTLSEIRNPNKTIILSDLEREYGIPTNTLLSEATRRTRLAELVFGASGNGTEVDLQTALRNAGFDVFVYQNDPAVDPAIFLEQDFQMVAAGDNAFAGRADAFAGRVGGELLVNGEIFKTSRIFTSGAGSGFFAGTGHGAGEYEDLLVEKIEYSIPTNTADWPMVFFVGGAVTRDFIELLVNGGFEDGFTDWIQNSSVLETYASYTQWAATTAYTLGQFRVPTVDNGFKYEVTTAGTSGAGEPTWPLVPGNTVVDGTVTWTARDFNVATGDFASKLVATGSNATGAETVKKPVFPKFIHTVKVKVDVDVYIAGIYRIFVLFYDADELLISLAFQDFIAATTGFEQVERTVGPAGSGADVVFPAGTAFMSFQSAWISSPTGTAYLDDIEIFRSDKQSITNINLANVDGTREDEFKRIILQRKPIHSWAALIVNFT